MSMPSLGPGGQSTFAAMTGRGEHHHPDLAATVADHEGRISRLESPAQDEPESGPEEQDAPSGGDL